MAKPQMWCPYCERVTTCKADPNALEPMTIPLFVGAVLSGHDDLPEIPRRVTKDRNWRVTPHPDIVWFQRRRQCEECFGVQIIAEVRELLVTDLADCRDKAQHLHGRINEPEV